MKVLQSVKDLAGLINVGRSIASEFAQVKELVLTHNSQADVEFEKKNPVPAANEPDYKQVLYFAKRAFALGLELIQAIAKEVKD